MNNGNFGSKIDSKPSLKEENERENLEREN